MSKRNTKRRIRRTGGRKKEEKDVKQKEMKRRIIEGWYGKQDKKE